MKLDRSVIVSCDVKSLKELENLIRSTNDVEKIGGYKVGPLLTIPFGLRNVSKIIRDYSDLPIIYDHQKGGTDIPELGEDFVDVTVSSGADAIILFPMSGPNTEKAWIEACNNKDVCVIVGGEMTHQGYKTSEGGYISDEALDRIYTLAAELGVTNYVVPGNRVDRIKHYLSLLESKADRIELFSPGLITQGGSITDAARAAGKRWHAIVGRYIYRAEDIRAAAIEATSQL